MDISVTARRLISIMGVVQERAEKEQTCLRKSVGVAAVYWCHRTDSFKVFADAKNGPSVPGNPCSNVVGNCGCSHAEPRVIIKVAHKIAQMCKQGDAIHVPARLVLVSKYSPCTTCANIVIDSGMFHGVVYDTLTKHDIRGKEYLDRAMTILSLDEMRVVTLSPDMYGSQLAYDMAKSRTWDCFREWCK